MHECAGVSKTLRGRGSASGAGAVSEMAALPPHS